MRLPIYFLVASLMPGVALARTIDRIAAVVDGEVITESEVRARAAPFLMEIDREIKDDAERQSKKADVVKQTLQAMIDEKLVLGAAEELQLSVTSEEVDRAIDRVLKQNGYTLTDLERELKAQGMSLKRYREDIREQLLRLKAISAKIQSKVTVSEDDARAACETDLRTKGGIKGLEVHLMQMVFKLPQTASEAEVEAQRKKAQTALERVKKGEDFAKVAAEASEDSTVDLGSFDIELLDPALGDAVRKMKIGEVSEPLREPGLFRILKLTERKETGGSSCDAQLAAYKAALEEKATEKALASYLAELRKKAYIEVKL
jgi:peptidyl-prolyl cis-trans isomerase SurA